jgi:hypothetical protein
MTERRTRRSRGYVVVRAGRRSVYLRLRQGRLQVGIRRGKLRREDVDEEEKEVDRVLEAAKWLKAALDGGAVFAQLHLAHLAFDADLEDTALALLKKHLSWRVQQGRNTGAGCWQKWDEDTPKSLCLCPKSRESSSSRFCKSNRRL